ncbi:MAG TPA: ATP-binding protein, partial [Calditrichia bacterium]|nr:ATP-binding protein [Calditrichia bacterium]
YQIIRNEHLNSLLESFLAKPVLISDEVRLDDNRTLEAVIAPVRMHNSEEVGAVMVLRDISHFKKLEKIRTDFVANVSHEFKTPLAAIRGYAESMLDWGLEDEEISRKYLRKVLKQSHQLENLVADLLQLARIERLQNIELSPFNPHPLLNDIVHQYAELATSKQLEFTYQEPTEPALVPGDPEMFRSIIVNLVDNAIKYTPEGGRVSLSVNTTSNHIIFSVADTGLGIPEKYQSRIFERFYRMDKARSRAIGGTGLGLSIVKHLCELQNAQVSVKSSQDEGSIFYVKFPRFQATRPSPEPLAQPETSGMSDPT